MRPPHHHLIVGDGATAAFLAETAPVASGDRLTIVGPDVFQLGRGLAYRDHPADRPWRYAYLMNSPSGVFGAAFTDWLARNWNEIRAALAGRRPDWLAFGADHIAAEDFGALFAPRAIYGDYLADRARNALADLDDSGVTVSLRTGLASNLARDGKGFRITLSSGEVIRADRVDVATGGPAPQRYGADAGPTAFTTLYGNEDAIAEVLRPGQEVTCLGGNAAMLDVLRFLQSVLEEKDIRLRVISRGEEPEPLVWTRPRRKPVTPALRGPFPDAGTFLAAVDTEIAAFRKAGATMAELRPGYVDWVDAHPLAALLPSLTEQRLVLPRLERRFRRGTHDSIANYRRLREAGRITEVRGDVTWAYAEAPGHVRIRVAAPDGSRQELRAGLTINTSGPGDQLALDLLTSGLVRNGWLKLNDTRTGLCVGPGLEAEVEGLRYLSPAVTEIGDEVIPLPLYDLAALERRARQGNATTGTRPVQTGRA